MGKEKSCEPKSLDVVLNISGVERIRSENLRLRYLIRVLNERSVSDGENLRPMCLVILKFIFVILEWNK